MSTGTLGGLAGKARRARCRSHAEQRFADRLIADYYEPRDRARRFAVDAPIRGRSEFMPSLLSETDMADDMADSQLELSWDEKLGPVAAHGPAHDRRVVWSTGSRARDTESAVARIRIPHVSATGAKHRDVDVEQNAANERGPTAVVAGAASEPPAHHTGTRVLRMERRTVARMPIGWSQAQGDRPAAHFSLRGFVRGCAIGGVAAAAVLAVLSIALG